jgi:NAD(P)H dehydrogenase (quinone)
VTGATGRQGGSGRAVVKALIESGHRVRALVRRLDERATALETLGAELSVGDYADYASLLKALDGIESAYFCYPVGAGIAEAAGLFATAGRDRGLRRIVDLSLATTKPDSPSPQGRAQWVAEQIFEWAGFEGVHLRIAAFFMENILLIDGPGIRKTGRIANSFGDAELSWVSGADVGKLAATLLSEPQLTGERVLLAPGTQHLTYPQIASAISSTIGRPVDYVELTPEAWREALIEASKARGETNVRGADHLVAQSVALRARVPLPTSDLWTRLTGAAPIEFTTLVEDHRTELTPA